MNTEILNSLYIRNQIKAWVLNESDDCPNAATLAREIGDYELRHELPALKHLKSLPDHERESAASEAVQNNKKVRQKLFNALYAHCFATSPEVRLGELFNVVETDTQLTEHLDSPFTQLPSSNDATQVEAEEQRYIAFGNNLVDQLDVIEKWRGACFLLAMAYIDLMHGWGVKVKDSNESIAHQITMRLCSIYGISTSPTSLNKVYEAASKVSVKIGGSRAPENPLSDDFLAWWKQLIINIASRAHDSSWQSNEIADCLGALPKRLQTKLGIEHSTTGLEEKKATAKPDAKKPTAAGRAEEINKLPEKKRSSQVKRYLTRFKETGEIFPSIKKDGVEIDQKLLAESIAAGQKTLDHLKLLQERPAEESEDV
jgi:hypothetical protein